MAKSLEELLKQKDFSGKDVGTLFLYSLKKDIEDSYKSVLSEPAVPQEFFDQAYKLILNNKNEYETWMLYKKLEGKYFQQQNTYQIYRQQFFHFYAELELLFEEMERMDGLVFKLKELNLSDEKFESIAGELFTTPSLFTEKNSSKLTAILDAIDCIKEAFIYFYCANKAFRDLFERFDVSFMDSTLFKVEELEGKMSDFNKLYDRVLQNKDSRTTNLLLRLYEPMEDFGQFYPIEGPVKFNVMMDDIADGKASDLAIIDGIESTIDFMVQDVKKINGID